MSGQHLTPLIHDCDPGPDDSLALMVSFSSPNWEVVGITTVGGNANVTQCARNARKIVALCGHRVPVYIGMQQPMERKITTLEDIFTASGLPGADDLPDPDQNNSPTEHAVQYLVDRLGSPSATPHIICATGPLTNIAMAILKKPSITKNIKRLVLMGGCVFPEPVRHEMGNFRVAGTDGKAEFNFATDPEAASLVFTSDIKDIAMIGLNVTRKVLFNSTWRDRFHDLGNPVAQTAAKLLSCVTDSHKQDLGHLRAFTDDPVRAVHDAVAVVFIDHPELFTTHKMYVRIVTAPFPDIAGQSLPCNWDEKGASRYPLDVVMDADTDKVFELMCERLATYNTTTMNQTACG